MQTVLIFFPLMILVYAWYSTSQLQRKILVTYRRVDNTKIEMFVPIISRYLYFDKKRFYIIKKCNTQQWYRRGVHALFPTKITTADYVWSSEWPIDPDTGKIYVVSPEVRFAMNQEERFVAYNRAQAKTANVKTGFFARYGTIIAIGLVVVVALFLYTRMNGLDASITALAQYYKDLASKVIK